jgi:hypothetical protein
VNYRRLCPIGGAVELGSPHPLRVKSSHPSIFIAIAMRALMRRVDKDRSKAKSIALSHDNWHNRDRLVYLGYVDFHDRLVVLLCTGLVDGSENRQMAIEQRTVLLFPIEVLHFLSP